ncbi:5-hydroxytryptamine receptor 3A-like [Menidia menidia]
MLTMPLSKLWVPDVAIQEDVSDTSSVQREPLVRLLPGGMMVTTERQRLTYTCQLDLAEFPFDTQHCNITFSSMSSDGGAVRLATSANGGLLTSISVQMQMTQGEWKLSSMQVQSQEGGGKGSRLVYMISLQRRPMLYLVNLLVPMFFLLVLDLASFLISPEGGEKLGFQVTVLLSISVLLLILQEILPSTEENLPAIAQYFVGVFAMMWVSTLETMLVGYIAELDGWCGNTATVDVQPKEAVGDNDPASDRDQDQDQDQNQDQDQDLLKQVLDQVRATQRDLGGKAKPGRFRKLANTIDNAFFVLHLIMIVAFMVYMLMLWKNALIR